MRHSLYLVMIVFSIQAMAQEKTEFLTISGQVLDTNGQPAKNTKVVIREFASKVISIAQNTVDQTGKFSVQTTETGPFWILFANDELGYSDHFVLALPGEEISLTARYLTEDQRPSTYQSAEIVLSDPEIAARTHATEAIRSSFTALHQELMKSNGKITPIDFSERISELEQKLRKEKNAEAKSTLFIQYLALENLKLKVTGNAEKIEKLLLIDLDIDLVKEAYRHISPTSHIWSIEPLALMTILQLEPESYTQYRDYFLDVIKNNSYEVTQIELLYRLIGFTKKRKLSKDFADFYGELVSNYPESHTTFKAKEQFGVETSLSIGQKAPDFTISQLDDPEKNWTNKDLEGKVYLLEFWSLGCRGCIMDMPKLHEAYEQFKHKGFEILSVNLGGEAEIPKTQEFRINKYPMPWLNGWVKNSYSSDITRAFEVYAIPSPYLIDEKGKIIARGMDLRDDNLIKTLTSYFQNK